MHHWEVEGSSRKIFKVNYVQFYILKSSCYIACSISHNTMILCCLFGLEDDNLYNVPVQRVVALYDYQAQGPEELTLHDGDIITLVAKEDDEWWKGQLNGLTGEH